MIVMVIVAIWVLFNWLANMGSDPQQYLEQIRKQNANSWIAAHNLAEELRTKPALRQDADVAQELGVMLDGIDRAGRGATGRHPASRVPLPGPGRVSRRRRTCRR